MIVSIRGTHGSGKSTIARKIIERYPGVTFTLPGKKKILMYELNLPNGMRLAVIGDYTNACGGCDGIQPYSDILPRILKAKECNDHVLFEGALVSSSYGTIGRALEQFPGEVVYAFMDTPLDVCLERISLRRAAKGNLEPVNPEATTAKFKSVEGSKRQIDAVGGQTIITVDHRAPIKRIMKEFGVILRKEPA